MSEPNFNALGAAIRTFVRSSAESMGGDTLFLTSTIPNSLRSFIHTLFNTLKHNAVHTATVKDATVVFILCVVGTHKDETGADNPTRAVFFVQAKGNYPINCNHIISECSKGFSVNDTNHVNFSNNFFQDPYGLIQQEAFLVKKPVELNVTLALKVLPIVFLLAFLMFAMRPTSIDNHKMTLPSVSEATMTYSEEFIMNFLSATPSGKLPDKMSKKELMTTFLKQFYLKNILEKLPPTQFWSQFKSMKSSVLLEVMKEFLTAASSDLDRFLLDEVIEVPDVIDDFEKTLFSVLTKTFSNKKKFPVFANEQPSKDKMKCFLDWFSYKCELSYAPTEEQGRILHKVLLEEYDFIRNEKWRVLRRKSLR